MVLLFWRRPEHNEARIARHPFGESTVETQPTSLLAAAQYFADPAVCNHYMREIKWPGGELCCHHCGSVRVGGVDGDTRAVSKAYWSVMCFEATRIIR